LITIVLAEDHQIVRQSLRVLLEAEPGFHVVGETGDGLQAIQLVEELRPEVLVLDLMMPGVNGLEVARQVRRRSADTKVVILSMHANEAYVLDALHVGATAYVLKESASHEFIHAIREAAVGRRYLSSPLSEQAMEVYLQRIKASVLDPYETLSPREQEVLRLTAEGFTRNQIADQLAISPRTVETYRASLMRKLNLNRPIELIHYALQRGIVSPQN
jgi:RNA polymerase sigma factor (sigma-70 family)